MSKLLTNNYKLNLANQLLESISEEANNSYYLYTAKPVSIQNSATDAIYDKIQETEVDQFRTMIFGKKVTADDAAILIRNVPWETGKYDMYDSNSAMFDKNFYAVCDEDSFYHVYKCLDNNLGANSTIQPEIAFTVGANNQTFRTADGYVWKYMYSVTEFNADKFKTENYFPVFANSTVTESATKGSIDVITIDGQGKGYGNYLTGTFAAGDLRISGNTTLYKISNTQISFANGFYTGCMLYLSSGIGVGQYRTINTYFTNSNGNFIVIGSEFDVPPVNGTQYQVTPTVSIVGSGHDLVNAYARALVNANASNAIYRVEMLEVGLNYDYAVATVLANDVVGVISNSIVRPIYSPPGGHGANTAAELGAKTISFVTRFSNSESNTIPFTNQYQTIGLIKDPLFANVNLELKDKTGTYIEEETLFVVNPVRIATNACINTTSSVLSVETLRLSNVEITDPGSAGSYVPGDILIINPSTGTEIVNAEVTVSMTEVRSVSIGNNGSGYVNGDAVALTTGTGTQAEFLVTTNATGFPSSITIQSKGSYTVNPTLANAATSGGTGTGLRLTTTMQIANLVITDFGAYARLPNTTMNALVGGSGTGAKASLTFSVSGAGSFLSQFTAGDRIYITDAEDTVQQLAVVNGVSNDTHLTLQTNGLFSCATAFVYFPRASLSAMVYNVPNATHIQVSNTTRPLFSNDLVIGIASGAKAVVNTVSRNGVNKGFETFNQLYKYNIDIVSGAFTVNEQMYQGTSLSNSTANAYVFGVGIEDGQTILYSSNNLGRFTGADQVIGANSGAIATLNDRFDPELEFGSGEILYIENIDAVLRANDQTEQFKLIFEL